MMTYEEFEKEIQRISDTYGVAVEVSGERDNVTVKLQDTICVVIDKDKHYLWNTMFTKFKSLKDSLKYELFVVCSELAQTPIQKREPEKKFYLKHKFLYGYDNEMYLNQSSTEDLIFLGDKRNVPFIQTEFTQKEIDQLKEKYNTDLKDFEIIEVKE